MTFKSIRVDWKNTLAVYANILPIKKPTPEIFLFKLKNKDKTEN